MREQKDEGAERWNGQKDEDSNWITLSAISSFRICPVYVQMKVPLGISSKQRRPHPLEMKTKIKAIEILQNSP